MSLPVPPPPCPIVLPLFYPWWWAPCAPCAPCAPPPVCVPCRPCGASVPCRPCGAPCAPCNVVPYNPTY